MVNEELYEAERQDDSGVLRSAPPEEVGSANVEHNYISPESRTKIMDFWFSLPPTSQEHASEPVEDDKNYVFPKEEK